MKRKVSTQTGGSLKKIDVVAVNGNMTLLLYFWLPRYIRLYYEEIEEGVVVPVRTRLVNKQDEIINEINRLNNSAADRLSICSAFGGMQIATSISLTHSRG
jgi:hypothetical protein